MTACHVERGHLSVDVHDEAGQPITKPLQLFLSANAPSLGTQYRVASKGGDDDIGGTFPAGSYTIQVFADGYDIAHKAVDLSASNPQCLSVLLKKASFTKPTLAERLAVYGLKPKQLEPLHVQSDSRLVLDYRTYENKKHFTVLRPNSVNDLKGWVGAPDNAFADNQPRFGEVPRGSLESLDSVAREFIYGNSRAVAQFTQAIDEQLQQRDQLILVPIFFFTEVVIDNGATLVIGNGSSVFFADILTMYPAGVLQVVGDVRSDIGLLQQK
jgi:hypothetical protein